VSQNKVMLFDVDKWDLVLWAFRNMPTSFVWNIFKC